MSEQRDFVAALSAYAQTNTIEPMTNVEPRSADAGVADITLTGVAHDLVLGK
jgi:hypothetical protein